VRGVRFESGGRQGGAVIRKVSLHPAKSTLNESLAEAIICGIRMSSGISEGLVDGESCPWALKPKAISSIEKQEGGGTLVMVQALWSLISWRGRKEGRKEEGKGREKMPRLKFALLNDHHDTSFKHLTLLRQST
jgi:hypothetical protein